MIIEVDRAVCEGHGLCEQTSPEIFEVDEEGYSRVLVGEITPDLRAAAESGARACPVAALFLLRS
ncbi:ferredoxin [Actinomycetospora flava]|uniref:Ferredoxin n=1 Tax=Actinomycetospora flava TaxID=3129232 RepID=A0ABU8M4A4_9PSEU